MRVLLSNQILENKFHLTLHLKKYSNPSGHGALIVGKVLTNPTLYKEWTTELKQIAETLRQRRIRLRGILEEKAPSKDWSGITRQIGRF